MARKPEIAEDLAQLVEPPDASQYICESDLDVQRTKFNREWPTEVRVLAVCGCLTTFRVIGKFLEEHDTALCNSAVCILEWDKCRVAAHSYLEGLR